MSVLGAMTGLEVITSVQRWRRWSADEKAASGRHTHRACRCGWLRAVNVSRRTSISRGGCLTTEASCRRWGAALDDVSRRWHRANSQRLAGLILRRLSGCSAEVDPIRGTTDRWK